MDLNKIEYTSEEIREYVSTLPKSGRDALLVNLIADSHKSLVDKNLCRRNIVTLKGVLNGLQKEME